VCVWCVVCECVYGVCGVCVWCVRACVCVCVCGVCVRVYVCVVCFFLNKFIHNMLHYRVIPHVPVYTLLHNYLSIAVW